MTKRKYFSTSTEKVQKISKAYIKTSAYQNQRKRRKNYVPSIIRRPTKRTEPFVPMNPLLDAIFRTTTWGLPDHIIQNQGESAYSYDFNSMYAAILAFLPIPGGIPSYFDIKSPIDFTEFQEKLKPTELAFCWAHIKAPKTSTPQLPYTVPHWTRPQGRKFSLIEKDFQNNEKLHPNWFYHLHKNNTFPRENIKDPAIYPHHQTLFPKGEWYGAYHSFMLETAKQQGYEIKIIRGFIFKNLNAFNPDTPSPWIWHKLNTPQEEVTKGISDSKEDFQPLFRESILSYYAYRLKAEGKKDPSYETITLLSKEEQKELIKTIKQNTKTCTKTSLLFPSLYLPLERFYKTFTKPYNTHIYYFETFLYHWPSVKDPNEPVKLYPITLPSIPLNPLNPLNPLINYPLKTPTFPTDTQLWWKTKLTPWKPKLRSRQKKETPYTTENITSSLTPFSWKYNNNPNTLSIPLFNTQETINLQWTQKWNQILQEIPYPHVPTLKLTDDFREKTSYDYIKQSFYKDVLAQAHGFQGTQPRFSWIQAAKALQKEVQTEWAEHFMKLPPNKVPPLFLLTYLSNPFYWEYKGPNSMILASAVYAHASLLIEKAFKMYGSSLFWNKKDTLTLSHSYPCYILKKDLGFFKNTAPDPRWMPELEIQWTIPGSEIYYPNIEGPIRYEQKLEWTKIQPTPIIKWQKSEEWNPRTPINTTKDWKKFPLFNYCLFIQRFIRTAAYEVHMYKEKYDWDFIVNEDINWERNEWPSKKIIKPITLEGNKEFHPWTFRYPRDWPSITEIKNNSIPQEQFSVETPSIGIPPLLDEEELIDINWLFNKLSHKSVKTLLGITWNENFTTENEK